MPRITGKDGTFDTELYIHRTGRAGRFGSTRTADAVVLYDRSQGEATTLEKLQDDMDRLHGVEITPRQLPSPSEVMDASYDRVLRLCEGFEGPDKADNTQPLVRYFADKLSRDLTASVDPSENESLLIHRLAAAMAALSGLDNAVPPRSLLTADPRDRTVRVSKDSCSESNPLNPSDVTKVVKSLGSGKLGRMTICSDGSAVLDLVAKKAELLLENASSDVDVVNEGWHFELPDKLTL